VRIFSQRQRPTDQIIIYPNSDFHMEEFDIFEILKD